MRTIHYMQLQQQISMIKQSVRKLLNLSRINNKPFKPIIVSDIDGVLLRGSKPIAGTYDTMLKIHEHKLPFACLTNGGGQLEQIKTDKLNKAYNAQLFDASFMFMNHTPLKPVLSQYSKEPGYLLLTGSLNVQQILKNLHISNYITADELYAIYMIDKQHYQQSTNNIYTLHKRKHTPLKSKQAVEKRLHRSLHHTFRQQILQCNSIFALNDVSPYETTLQVIHNLLGVRQEYRMPKIHYYAAQNDIVWAGGYNRPRMAFGPFNYILSNHCERHRFSIIDNIYYGKPQKKVFEYVEQEMRRIEPQGVLFMIGDNPRADIRGANNIGWYSFLTRTGIHHGQQNDNNDPATFIVDDFNQAVQVIIQAYQQAATMH